MTYPQPTAPASWITIAVFLSTAVAFLSYMFAGQDTAGLATPRSGDVASLRSGIVWQDTPETAVVPAGTRIHVRLQEAFRAETKSPGDRFTASLDGPLIVDLKVMAPSRAEVIGELTKVEESDRAKGRARLTMVLRKLIVKGKEFPFDTEPLTVEARADHKRDSAVIGAITGRGSGAVYALETGPDSEARFAFTLTNPVQLPVFRTMRVGRSRARRGI